MNVFTFNNRPFALSKNKVMKLDKPIYELLAQDDDALIYPYEAETAAGRRVTRWRNLSPQEAAALLDEQDTRPLVERLDWTMQARQLAQELDAPIAIKRVAPIAHKAMPFTLVDASMQVSHFAMPVNVETWVALVRYVKDNETYNLSYVQKTFPDLYDRLTARLPKDMPATALVLLTGAEQIAAQLRAQSYESDSIIDVIEDSDKVRHIVGGIDSKHMDFLEQYVEGLDFEDVGTLDISDVGAMNQLVGAYLHGSMIRALKVLMQGTDARLATVKRFLEKNGIAYTVVR